MPVEIILLMYVMQNTNRLLGDTVPEEQTSSACWREPHISAKLKEIWFYPVMCSDW